VRKIPAKAWALALLSSGLQVLIFPPTSLYFLSWVAIVPLLYALLRGRGGPGELVDSEGRSLRPYTPVQGFMIGWVNGVVWYLGVSYWIYPVMNGYGHIDPIPSFFIMLGFCLILGMHQAVFALVVVLMARRSSLGNRRPLFLAPFFWVAIEFFRDRATPFFWEPLGTSQVNNIPFAQVAQLTGVYGLSFAIVLVNCAFTAALLLYGVRRRNLLIAAGAAAIALQIGVFARPEPSVATRQAALGQPNLDVPDAPWTSSYYEQTLTSLIQLSVNAAHNPLGNPGLIVWPESPAPFWANDPGFQSWMAKMARDANSYLVIGSTALRPDAHGQTQMFNSALVVDPSGGVVGRYDKIHLVPFGEYVPLRDLLFFAGKLTREVGDFSRGTERYVFDLNGTRIGVFICYESIYPGEVRQFAANGAQVLVNISDDGWFGHTGAPAQHMQMARMRALENHRWVLISTNSGLTVSIDPLGRVVKMADPNVRTVLVAPFTPLTETTIYTRYGDLFAWICVVISLIAVLVRWRIRARTMIEAPSA
jgi:apolipoprotein N-acyltransferase